MMPLMTHILALMAALEQQVDLRQHLSATWRNRGSVILCSLQYISFSTQTHHEMIHRQKRWRRFTTSVSSSIAE